MIPADPVVKNPASRFGDVEDFGQQLIDVQHVHPSGTHQVREYIVILLRLLDPEHIIKQQGVAIAGR